MSQIPDKLFTIESANQTLPLVRAIVQDMVVLAREIQERRHRLGALATGRHRNESDPYASELAHIEQELDKDIRRLNEYAAELVAIGAEPKDPLLGLVDFPSIMDGRIVYLCWKLGEKEIQHWHELDAGFSGRKSLTAESAVGPDDDLFEDWK